MTMAIAKQIAEGFEEAHEHGLAVVQRSSVHL
jgi:hypothetical protein